MADSSPTYEQLLQRVQEQDALIAQLRLSEERMADCELLARGWFDSNVIGMAQMDVNGRFKRANAHFCKMLGYTAEELVGHRGPLDLTHPDDVVADRERIAKLLSGTPYHAEKRMLARMARRCRCRSALSRYVTHRGVWCLQPQ